MLPLVLFKILVLHLLQSTVAELKISEFPFLQVDAYAPCVRRRGDAHCLVSAKLSTNNSHPLYNALLEHSSNKLTHFNRTNVHRGICLKSCQEYSASPDVKETLESCLNATLSRDYGLSARVFRILCSEYRERVQFDACDFAFGAIVVVLLVLNLLGTVYEFYGGNEKGFVGKLLLCFAVRRNWSRLVAPESREPELRRLCNLSAYRVFYTLWVVFGHTGFPFIIMIKNPEFIEQTYNDISAQILYNGTHIVQVFFVISALLLAYNILVEEKHQRTSIAWQNLHKAIFARWLRLTPVYALVIFFIATWMRHAGDGPFWKAIVESETAHCRRDWWLHLLYIQNYFDIDSRCMLHSWYLPVEMQVTIVGLSVFFLLKSTKARQAAIGMVVAVGLVTPAVTTFYHDIDPVLIHSPETALSGYETDSMFNKLYKRSHTNLICYGLGLALGYIVFYLKESDIGAQKFKKYSVLHRLLFPASLALMLTGAVLYVDTPPLLVRAIYSSAIKFFFGLLTCLHIFFTIVQADSQRARIYNWHVWTVLRRLTYCVYLIHMSVLSILAGHSSTTVYASKYNLFTMFAVAASASFLLAVPLFLLVEAPCAQVARICLGSHKNKRAD